MTFLVIFISIFGSALVCYFLSTRRSRSKVDIEKVVERTPSFGPESFLNHIKSELPRGHGLMYEVSTRIYKRPESNPYTYWPENLTGDFLVEVKILDPISDELLESITFNERNNSKSYASMKILSAVTKAFKAIEAQKIAGDVEIIS